MSDRLKTILVSLSLLLNLVLGVVAARYFQRPGAGTEDGSFINAPPRSFSARTAATSSSSTTSATRMVRRMERK